MANSSNTVRASHILVKHKGSRRPSSWKEATVTRSQVKPRHHLLSVQPTLKLGQHSILAASWQMSCIGQTRRSCPHISTFTGRLYRTPLCASGTAEIFTCMCKLSCTWGSWIWATSLLDSRTDSLTCLAAGRGSSDDPGLPATDFIRPSVFWGCGRQREPLQQCEEGWGFGRVWTRTDAGTLRKGDVRLAGQSPFTTHTIALACSHMYTFIIIC